jgi:hypothetical protein
MSKPEHEPGSFDARRVAYFGLALLVSVGVISGTLLAVLHTPRSAQRNAIVIENAPQPNLQASPADDLSRYRDDKQALLHGYGWVDRKRGIVRIPIERAMNVISAQREQNSGVTQ